MKQIYVYLAAASMLIVSCDTSVKEKLNKAGEVAGQAAGEFAAGVSTGVESAVAPEVNLSDSLKKAGLELGTVSVDNDSDATDNVLVVYLIFNNDINATLTAKAISSSGKEIGRARTPLNGKKNDSAYLEFRFDRRTNIENNTRILIE